MKNVQLYLVFLLGFYITLAVYHFMVYLGRKEDKNNLFYVILVLCFAYLLIFKTIIPDLNVNSAIIPKKLEKLFMMSSPDVCILGIILFTYNIFKLKKLKYYAIFGYIFLVLFTSIICSIIFLYTDNYRIGQIISAPVKGTFGIIYWILLNIIFFNKKEKKYKEKWLFNIYISVNIFYIFFMIYPFLVIIKFSDFNQLLFANVGLIAMAVMSASSLTSNFNKEHYDLINLTTSLEQKVLDRTRQLEDAYQQKINFFINFSHETRTPLTLITNYLDKDIKIRGQSPEIKIVKQNVDKLIYNTENFLDIEKLNKGKTFYNHNEINDFSEILRIKKLMFNEIAVNNKNIKITSYINPNLYIKIDGYALDRIINNLLDNAIRYTNHGGKIEITLKSINDKIEFMIKDNGIGIPENEISHIFEPYYQISHNKRNIQGIGMGLSIVKKIIDEVKGEIEVISKENEGSTFKVIFEEYKSSNDDNIIKENKQSSPADDFNEIKLAEEDYSNTRYNILIVEDNLEMLSYLQENFKNDYNVFCTINGQDALAKLNIIPRPHVIIADIMMDIMDGYEFYENIKKDNTFSSIPFIFITAKSGVYEKLKGLSKGAIDFIRKPFSIDELLIKVKNIMKNKVNIEKDIVESLYETSKNKLQQIKTTSLNYDKLKSKYDLTDKEIDVIRLIHEKLTNKEIAIKLNYSETTIKNKLSIIFEKLVINKRDEINELLMKNQ